MSTYAGALSRLHDLLERWRTLPTREEKAATRDAILDVMVEAKRLPKDVHRALQEAAREGEAYFAKEAQAEEAEIAKLDGAIAPLVREMNELQRRLDELTRLRKGRENRLHTLRDRQREAASLTGLPAERVTSVEDAERWLVCLPSPELPPPAEPFQTLNDLVKASKS